MKRLAALLLISLAFCACSNNLNNDEKTASFSTVWDLMGYWPEEWRELEPVIYLVSEKTLEQINEYHNTWQESEHHGVYSWDWNGAPTDSDYVYTPYDLIDLFRTGKISSIQEDFAYSAAYQDIPYGKYFIIYALCLRYQNMLTLFDGIYGEINVNENINGKQLYMPLPIGNGWGSCGVISIPY